MQHAFVQRTEAREVILTYHDTAKARATAAFKSLLARTFAASSQ